MIEYQGMFYILGGKGPTDSSTGSTVLADFWEFDPATNSFTFIRGVTTDHSGGLCGAIGVFDVTYRSEERRVGKECC